ncbi:hypothetical protein Tco_0013172 [Tanacetum coccineum]
MGNRIRTRNSPDMLLGMILQFEFLSKSVLTRLQNARTSSTHRSRVRLVISMRSCRGANIVYPGSETTQVGQSRAIDKGAIKCLISTAIGIYKLRHTADHLGGDSGLLSDRAFNNS